MKFAPLHIYSGYTFLNSALTVEKIVSILKKNSFSCGGICDKNLLTGIPSFWNLCRSSQIKPIIGMDVTSEDGFTYSLIVLNEIGYKNLLNLQFLLPNQKSTISSENLFKFQEGLCLIIHSSNPYFKDGFSNKYLEFSRNLSKFTDHFSTYYIGLEIDQEDYMNNVRKFADEHLYKTVAFPLIQYEKADDAIVIDIVNAIRDEQKLDHDKKNGTHHFPNEMELQHFYTDEEIDNTIEISDSSIFDFDIKRGELPSFEIDSDLSEKEYIKKLCYDGLKQKIGEIDEEHKRRLDYELEVIDKMGFNSYFLIVRDYVNYAKTHDISVGPGRGSAAGSLASYALGIVAVDPLKFSLMFERFLNPERQTMPDIDIDFSDIRRDEIIAYLEKKYGYDRVSRIIAIQTIGAKQALRDIGRVYDIPTSTIDLLSKNIIDSNLSLRDDYKTSKGFRDLVDSDKYYLNIVALASKIEGLPRQGGLHAAGVILNKTPIYQCVPVRPDISGTVCAFEKDPLESQGMLKMDILSLRNLTIIDRVIYLIEKKRGIKLSSYALPYDDTESFKIICEGKTIGLFQLESSGMKNAIKEVKVDTFKDLIAIISLFRPGPMANIPSYARRKAGKEKITYLIPMLEPILKETYGIIVYQEQIMQIVQTVAGFSFGQADLFRRAISKKDETKLISLKEEFINAAVKNNVNKFDAIKIFELIHKFAQYGFNKSHALSYAVIAAQMAYLKTHYTAEFYAAILESTKGSNDVKFNEVISEMKSIGIKIKKPDINTCDVFYSVDEDSLLFALSSIKGVTYDDASKIIEERNNNGLFKNFIDFVKRANKVDISDLTIQCLIDAGCFDNFDTSRASLRANVLPLYKYCDMAKDLETSLFGDPQNIIPLPASIVVNDDKNDNLNREYAALGVFLSETPFFAYKNNIENIEHKSIVDAKQSKDFVTIVGIISSVKKITTKKDKKPMAFIKVYDESDEIECTIFPILFSEKGIALKPNVVVKIEGRIDENRDFSLSANNIELVRRDEQ